MNTNPARRGLYKWEVLALLWVAYFINQADRQVFNVVLPLVKADLQLTDVQVGAIATVFNLVFALMVPFSGYIGDVYSRKRIVVFSILFWSVATMATGLAGGVAMLILFRSVATGGGEALFGPANYALLAGYHKETRAFAMSVHQTAYYLGVILSGVLAAYIAERWGWRNAFYVFGAVGVIHGIVLAFRLKDRPVEGKRVKEPVSYKAAWKILLSTPTALLLTLGFSGLIFVLVGYLTWTPTYLYERFSMSLAEAGFHSVFYTHMAAFTGIMLVGRFSDKMARRDPSVRVLIQAFGLLAAVPFIILMGQAGSLVAVYAGFVGFGFCRALFDGNTYAVLYDVIPEKYQSSVSGIMMMTGFSVGSLSPILLGYIKPIVGLSVGIASLAGVWVVAGILMLVAWKFYFKNDYYKARQHG